jgi:hypothetical protein
MRQSIAAVAWLGLVAAAVVSPAAWSEDEVRDRVCVYEHIDYGGYEQCFAAGAGINSLGRFGNRISSVRILGRGEITLYEHPNFQGREVSINSDAPDLRRLGFWNDQADSLRVAARGGFRDGRDRDRDRGRDGRDRSFGEDRVCFFEDINFRGGSECWDAGDEVSDLRSRRWNDRISSVRVFGRTRVVLFEDNNYGGQRLVVDGDIADFTRLSVDGRYSWNDRVSSFRVSGGRRDGGRY